MVKYSCKRCGKKFSLSLASCENNSDKIKQLIDKTIDEKLNIVIDNKVYLNSIPYWSNVINLL